MLKRLGIGCLVVVVLLVAGVWFSYRRMVAGGDTTSVTIAAPAARVFAALAHHDSLPTWSAHRGQSGRHGAFVEGDTARVDSSSFGSRRSRSYWIVTAVVPDRLVALELRSEGSVQRRSQEMVIAVRRDSLVTVGDSTTIITTIASGLRGAGGISVYGDGTAEATALEASSKMLIGGMRMMAEADLKNLKNHIEGRPIGVPR